MTTGSSAPASRAQPNAAEQDRQVTATLIGHASFDLLRQRILLAA